MMREDMLVKHLRHSYSDNVAREKLASLTGFVGVAKDFYAVHRRRVFTTTRLLNKNLTC